MRLWTPGLLIFTSTLLVFAFSLNGVWAADHPTSLLQLSYALWADHSVVLGKVGQFVPGTVDDFAYKGNYYSALAPGVSVLALPFVGLGFTLDGGFNLFGNAMLFSELFVALCNAIAAYLVFKLASMYFTQRTSAFVAFAYAFSTISWPFATYFFESDVSAMLDVLAVYLAIRMARSGSSGLADAAPCGAALGAALTVDYLNGVLVPIVSIFLLYTFRKRLAGFVKGFVGFLVGPAVGVVLLALYNQAAFGDPFLTTEQAYQHTSSLLGSFSNPLLGGLYLDLFSPLRGVFVYCPILILGALGFDFILRRRETASEGLLLGACFVGFLLPYSMWYNAVGGEAFGQRFLIPVIPFLLLPSGFLIEAKRRGVAAIAYLLYGAGVIFNGIAGVTTAIPQAEAVSHFPFLTHDLPLFLKGQLDTWWWSEAGPAWWAPALLIIATALVLPLVISRMWGPEGAGVAQETRAPPARIDSIREEQEASAKSS
ncbi:MAG TPA: glycosyltransferase family 39 protein [Nitrososphaerales archaeon]|nr:glycosyltransferase family 39 protein [Nitrososphaerales archaeon]